MPVRRTSFPLSFLLALSLVFLPGVQRAEARVELQPCSNHIAPAQQIELGRKAAQQVYKQMPVLPDSSEVTQYVQSIGQKLAAHAPGYRWPFNFHVVNVADINAFALPGGTIFINLGTIQAADDEAQLAAVMAHEMSHVILQHSVCNLEKQQKVGIAAGIGQILSGIVLGNGVLGSLAANTIGLGAGLDFLKMSRGAERQADLMGVGILYDAGYDPRAMPQFFETIEGKYGQGGAQFLSDHPNPGNRTEYVYKEIASFPPRAHPVTNTPEFRRIHQLVSGMHPYTAKEVASGVWKQKDPNQTVSTGIDDYEPAAPGTSVDLAPPHSWTPFHGDGFSMDVPSSWRALGDRTSAMIAPPGGIAQSSTGQQGNLVYGVLTDLYRPDTSTVPNQLFAGLLNQLTRDNPGLRLVSSSNVNVGGRTANSVESVSPSANNGRGEHDWIIGIPFNGSTSGQSLRYFVFVAPEPDFATMRPTFQHILDSFRFQ